MRCIWYPKEKSIRGSVAADVLLRQEPDEEEDEEEDDKDGDGYSE